VMGGFGDMYGNDWIVNPHDAFCVGSGRARAPARNDRWTYACKRAGK